MPYSSFEDYEDLKQEIEMLKEEVRANSDDI